MLYPILSYGRVPGLLYRARLAAFRPPGNEALDELRIELGSRAAADFEDRLGLGDTPMVGPVVNHCREGIEDRHRPGEPVDLLAVDASTSSASISVKCTNNSSNA